MPELGLNADLESYNELYKAYDFFNRHIFAGKLPPCLITLQREKHTYGYFSHKRWVHLTSGEKKDEIALNPSYFGVRPIKESLSTLCHEMCHLQQSHYGKPGRGKYHNKEWATLMINIGLYPSNTGKPGGKTVGDAMSHYIMAGNLFDRVCDDLLTQEFKISWADRFPPRDAVTPLLPVKKPPASPPPEGDEDDGLQGFLIEVEGSGALDGLPSFGGSDDDDAYLVMPPATGKSNRVKYICPSCADAAWGKPTLQLLCGKCNSEPFIPVSEREPD